MRPPAVSGSPSDDAGQLIEVDGQGAHHHRRSAAEPSLKLVGHLIIPVPASPPEANREFASQLGGTVHTLHDGRDETVAGQLERIIVGADAVEQVNDSRSVTAVYRRRTRSAARWSPSRSASSGAAERLSSGPSDRGG